MNGTELVNTLAAVRRGAPWPVGLEWDASHEEALATQLAVLDALETEVGGWKVGMTSGASRDRLGEGFRPFGYVLEDRILASGATLGSSVAEGMRIEAELCLTLGAPVSGPVEPDEARRAVRSVRPAFELNEPRAPRSTGPALTIANGLGNWGIVVGPEAPVPTDFADLTVTLHVDGTGMGSGSIADMDDPFVSLARLSATLGRHGRGLLAGQPVITGALAAATVSGPGSWLADFGPLGTVALRVGGLP